MNKIRAQICVINYYTQYIRIGYCSNKYNAVFKINSRKNWKTPMANFICGGEKYKFMTAYKENDDIMNLIKQNSHLINFWLSCCPQSVSLSDIYKALNNDK